MMRLKDNTVKVNGICREILDAVVIIGWICERYGVEGVITSGSESTTKHSPTSKHYTFEAVDLRSRDLFAEGGETLVNAFMVEVNSNIGPGYDLIFEGDHFHLEWDPK